MAKGPDAFRTISEASAEVGVPAHVLRFWESRLLFIKPMKRAGGRRFYRPQDIAVLRTVRVLLHERRLSLKAVQSLHRAKGVRGLADASAATGGVLTNDPALPIIFEAAVLSSSVRARLRMVLSDLEAAQARVDDLLSAPA